jgi:hypothetical protein
MSNKQGKMVRLTPTLTRLELLDVHMLTSSLSQAGYVRIPQRACDSNNTPFRWFNKADLDGTDQLADAGYS